MSDQVEPSNIVDIDKELQSARKKLLDLTMRNKLLNFRPSKARSIRVMDADPALIYDILVVQEKAMQFLEADEPHPQKDIYLKTSLESENLQKRLFYIYQDSKSVLEELGYSTLYLATTFLEWTESDAPQESRLAPLILIPVELERSGVRSAFKLKWNGEDISTNISLKEILLQQEVRLPDFEMADTEDVINNYLRMVESSLQTRPSWRVVNDTYLGFFSFTKFIMYKDIDPAAWPEGKSPAEHPLIRATFGSPEDKEVPDNGFQENEVDRKLKSCDLYHVLDADSSQIAVIEDVKAGRNLAVEGPPGTGKSQTIVNIVAELMAAGRSVLFVSEKMAALEVVKDRLDNVGLGDFCLELHSRKSNKKEFLANLERTVDGPPVKPASAGNEYDELESLKLELDRYAEDLRKPFGNIQLSPYALFHQKEAARSYFEKLSKPIPRVKLGNLKSSSYQDFDGARQKLRELQGILPLVAPIAGNPWYGCSPGIILPSHEEAIKELLHKCLQELENLHVRIDQIVEICAARPPAALPEIPEIVDAAGIMAKSGPIDRSVLSNSEWNRPNRHAENLIQKLKEFQGFRKQVLDKFKSDIPDRDPGLLLERYKTLSVKFLKSFNSEYRQTKRQILSLYNHPPHISDVEIIADLAQLNKYISLRNAVRGYRLLGQALFGSLWRGEESDPEVLQSFAEWIVAFRQKIVKRVLSERALDLVSKGVSPEQIEKAAGELDQSAQNIKILLESLARQTGANYEAVFSRKMDKVSIPDLVSRLQLWQSETAKLQCWSQYVAIRNQCLHTLAAPVISEIEKGALGADDMLPCFEGNFADDMLTAIFIERPGLANFIGSLHENKIRRFVELDRKLIMQNRQRLIGKLLEDRPGFLEGSSSDSEIDILKGEFNRKRGHMPIRKLMSRAGNLIRKIKPCFMMSPLSIAQFLDPETARFDVIIYDEASQLRPEDALGALLRGNQAVVIGDTRQLPPTAFFDHIIEDDMEEDPEAAASYIDTESILHQCRRCFPVKMLRWHYRSRHESLVAVSNKEFYNNRLLLYPSPSQESADLGLHLVHLPGTIYDRGAGQTNLIEAKAIAESAIEHYRRHPEKSLGIGAFNIRQQQAILEEIDLQLRQNPEMEEFFKSDRFEHFFVKNLETIQGDERDVIFISIGYGFDKYGKMTLNFGPLNNDGGERRLNVLITRAREKCVVFSNFKAADLQLDAGASRGLKALKLFLDFAENHNLDACTADENVESPFEDSVYEFLRDSGYEVRRQVGCAGFRVDLAIMDPVSKGNYLLGIECDGAKYHTSPVARDRDRLRQQILESLNWHIYRVWSTDWYRNRQEGRQKLVDAIEKRKIENENSHQPAAGT